MSFKTTTKIRDCHQGRNNESGEETQSLQITPVLLFYSHFERFYQLFQNLNSVAVCIFLSTLHFLTAAHDFLSLRKGLMSLDSRKKNEPSWSP